VAKALSTALHVAVGKEHVAKNSSVKKPLPPAKRKAVGKGNERHCEMTERIPFADCHAAVGKDFSYFFFITEFLCRLSLLAGGKGSFNFFSKQNPVTPEA